MVKGRFIMLRGKIFIIIMFLIAINLAGCSLGEIAYRLGLNNEVVLFEEGLIRIIGSNYTKKDWNIEPGTRVKFEIAWTESQIVFQKGARLVAIGTPENPIIFETEEISARIHGGPDFGWGGEFEYCEFKTGIDVSAKKVKYCKLEDSPLKCSGGTVENNDFIGSDYFSSYFIDCESNINISYNNISNSTVGIFIRGSNNTIKYNNITKTKEYAIYNWSNSGNVIDNNYVSNCNNLEGVDTTGSQSKDTTYSNPQTSSIAEAGCGW